MTPAALGGLARLPRAARRAARALLADPAEFITRVAAELRALTERNHPDFTYVVDENWEAELHDYLGAETSCSSAAELAPLWEDVVGTLAAAGVAAGPMSYLGWNDGDPAFIRAIWCLIRHLSAHRVVETGVAHGVTSRFVLEALARNGGGHLWSIDLPPQLHPELHWQIGLAVDARLRDHWTLVAGSSRRRLPGLLKDVGSIDLFVHDSLHTEFNVLFEMHQAWKALRPGGAIVVDDIDANPGFHAFCMAVPHARSWVCQSAPLRPDYRRSDDKGKFGIVMKEKK
jgi:predicted O-methyltransferase YrrM